MKEFKKLMSIIICMSMITAMFACGVSAAEVETDSTEIIVVEEEEETSLDEWLAAQQEKLYSSEVPEEFFLIPKEKMVIDGWDLDFALLYDKIDKGELSWEIFEPLYSYVAVVVEHDYLDPKGINPEDFEFNFVSEDIEKMMSYFSKSIKSDQLSYNLSETYEKYDENDFTGDAELTECIVKAVYTFCITAGIDPAEFWSNRDFYYAYGFSPEKITFSDEQLHYFDD